MYKQYLRTAFYTGIFGFEEPAESCDTHQLCFWSSVRTASEFSLKKRILQMSWSTEDFPLTTETAMP
ncbi:hypothetical protein Y1Q_0002241 [Alligator mississippiensis]|uniref:Uncharacterized protein n=1 Tax=Alligator mississippiensis TaxID=8496 RepID=A0A151MGE6_ALLMI|nr:hypothetical protein Y1Q_0002241 [Alligator mississippiensis]